MEAAQQPLLSSDEGDQKKKRQVLVQHWLSSSYYSRDLCMLGYYDPEKSCDFYMKMIRLESEKPLLGEEEEAGRAAIRSMQKMDKEAEIDQNVRLATMLINSLKKDSPPSPPPSEKRKRCDNMMSSSFSNFCGDDDERVDESSTKKKEKKQQQDSKIPGFSFRFEKDGTITLF